MPYYRIITFGCKVNQYDSAGLAQELTARGWREVPEGEAPDVILVNTCTVTARADQEARQTIRRVHRQFSRTPIWATGCYAQRAPEEVAALPGLAGVLGNREKFDGAAYVGETATGGQPLVRVGKFAPQEAFAALRPRRFPGHTRGSLKIQDGCSQACAYCIVPQVRGPSRSLAPPEVEKGLLELAASGFKEVVLTGIDLGQYGRDLRPPVSLAALLRRLADASWPCRLRLSSLEPQGISPELVKALGELPALCPHFHLPLQSGADPVLAAMGRPYRSEDFREVVLELGRRFPEAALGLDVLVGFPTETAQDFAATYSLVAALPATYLHVFPFSPRPGTPAASLPPVPAKEVKARAKSLRELGQLKQREFYGRQLGKIVEILVEGPAGPSGCLKGLSENYLRVTFPGPLTWQNRRLPVLLREMREGVLVGEALSR